MPSIQKKKSRTTPSRSAAAAGLHQEQQQQHERSLSSDADMQSMSSGTTHIAELLMQIQETMSLKTQKKHEQCLDKARKEAEALIQEHGQLQVKHQDELSTAYRALREDLAGLDAEMKSLGKQLEEAIRAAETTPVSVFNALHKNSESFGKTMKEEVEALQCVVDEANDLIGRTLLRRDEHDDEAIVEKEHAVEDGSEQEDDTENGF